MKVAMLTYSTRPRGGVVHALKLAERLSRMGADVTLYSLARADDVGAQRGYFRKVNCDYNIFTYRWNSDLITRLQNMISAYVDHLPRTANIYHAQDCVGGTALQTMKSKGLISTPVFRTIHHIDDFSEPRLFEFEKLAVSFPDFRFVVSKYWKKVLKAEYGFDSTITYNGIDIEDFSRLPRRKSKAPTVLFVGGLEPRKGLEYLLLAMEPVIERLPRAKLVAVAKTGFRGTDDWRFFAQLADRLGLVKSVEFHESVSQRMLTGLYSDCDILVMPSKTEGWGLSLMEAMACGKPVVASEVGGIPELVRDDRDGLLVGAGDVRGLANAITRLLESRTLRERLGRSGRARVARYSWDDTARVVLASYEKTLWRSDHIRS